MRYLLYKAVNGISDMLYTIQRCIIHCEKYNRILLIDTTNGPWFNQPFHNYITITHPLLHTEIPPTLHELSTYPPEFQGKLHEPYRFYIKDYDLHKNYDEDLLIYSYGGGGIPSYLLKYMICTEQVITLYNKRLSMIPDNYISIHIRNTDRQSNLYEFINKYESTFKNKPLFIASDHAESIRIMKHRYSEYVYTLSTIPDIPNNGIGFTGCCKIDSSTKHIPYPQPDISNHEFIIDCIVDILLAASGNQFYYTCADSGYSRLINYLHSNKSILCSILVHRC